MKNLKKITFFVITFYITMFSSEPHGQPHPKTIIEHIQNHGKAALEKMQQVGSAIKNKSKDLFNKSKNAFQKGISNLSTTFRPENTEPKNTSDRSTEEQYRPTRQEINEKPGWLTKAKNAFNKGSQSIRNAVVQFQTNRKAYSDINILAKESIDTNKLEQILKSVTDSEKENIANHWLLKRKKNLMEQENTTNLNDEIKSFIENYKKTSPNKTIMLLSEKNQSKFVIIDFENIDPKKSIQENFKSIKNKALNVKTTFNDDFIGDYETKEIDSFTEQYVQWLINQLNFEITTEKEKFLNQIHTNTSFDEYLKILQNLQKTQQRKNELWHKLTPKEQEEVKQKEAEQKEAEQKNKEDEKRQARKLLSKKIAKQEKGKK